MESLWCRGHEFKRQLGEEIEGIEEGREMGGDDIIQPTHAWNF